MQPFAKQVMSQINVPTQERENSGLICSTCSAYYREEANSPLDLDFGSAVGCRICNEKQGYFVGKMIAVLDNQLSAEVVEESHEVQVNWLVRRRVFDFDEIEIIQATDEEVERFVVQVGNDSDSFQKSRYKDVKYTISLQCELSDNTKRILRRMFGGLEEKHLDKAGDEEVSMNTFVNSA